MVHQAFRQTQIQSGEISDKIRDVWQPRLSTDSPRQKQPKTEEELSRNFPEPSGKGQPCATDIAINRELKGTVNRFRERERGSLESPSHLLQLMVQGRNDKEDRRGAVKRLEIEQVGLLERDSSYTIDGARQNQ